MILPQINNKRMQSVSPTPTDLKLHILREKLQKGNIKVKYNIDFDGAKGKTGNRSVEDLLFD